MWWHNLLTVPNEILTLKPWSLSKCIIESKISVGSVLRFYINVFNEIYLKLLNINAFIETIISKQLEISVKLGLRRMSLKITLGSGQPLKIYGYWIHIWLPGPHLGAESWLIKIYEDLKMIIVVMNISNKVGKSRPIKPGQMLIHIHLVPWFVFLN